MPFAAGPFNGYIVQSPAITAGGAISAADVASTSTVAIARQIALYVPCPRLHSSVRLPTRLLKQRGGVHQASMTHRAKSRSESFAGQIQSYCRAIKMFSSSSREMRWSTSSLGSV